MSMNVNVPDNAAVIVLTPTQVKALQEWVESVHSNTTHRQLAKAIAAKIHTASEVA